MRRRHLLQGLLFAPILLSPTEAWASTQEPSTLVLSCIDFRFMETIHDFLAMKGLTKQYDWTALAGASLALANFPHPSDSDAFWDQLKISVDLHHINHILVFEHQDCGAYNLIHPHLSENSNREVRIHQLYAMNAAQAIQNLYSQISVDAYFVSLSGGISPIELKVAFD